MEDVKHQRTWSKLGPLLWWTREACCKRWDTASTGKNGRSMGTRGSIYYRPGHMLTSIAPWPRRNEFEQGVSSSSKALVAARLCRSSTLRRLASASTTGRSSSSPSPLPFDDRSKAHLAIQVRRRPLHHSLTSLRSDPLLKSARRLPNGLRPRQSLGNRFCESVKLVPLAGAK